MDEALALAGQRAVTEATRLWNRDIYDPDPSDRSHAADTQRQRISEIIQAGGWGWAAPYRGPEPQWCGLFAAACWESAGLDPKWLATYWASTYRLGLWGTYQNFDRKHPNPPPTDKADRRVWARAGTVEPRAGDVLIVGDGNPIYGDHITLVVAYHSGTFDTISGNGGGVGPRGNYREGVSRREYGMTGGYHAMWILRPAFGDLLAEAP